MRSLALLAWCAAALAQTPAEAPVRPVTEAQGLPPRTAPTEYRAHAQAGTVSIAADFTGHSVGTPEGVLSTDDYVVIEAALFGPADARLMLSLDDFTLRINGKKAVAREAYALVVGSLEDPEYEAPGASTSGSKTSISGSGKSDARDLNAPPPPKPRVPVEVRRMWEQRVRKASLPLGDRVLPQAGLLFFPYGGRAQGIRTIDLIYSGPAGKTTLSIHP